MIGNYRDATGPLPEAAFDNDLPEHGPRKLNLGPVGQAGQDEIMRRIAGTKKDKATKAKAKPTKRLAPIPFDTPKNQRAIATYTRVLSHAFHTLGHSIANQLRTRAVGKADKTPEEILAEAMAIVEALDLSTLQVIVEDLTDAGIDVATDAGILAIAQFGMEDNASLIDHVNTRAVDFAKDRAAELIGMRYNSAGKLVPSANAEMRIDDSTRDMVRDSIVAGLQNGDRITEIADDLADLYAFSDERAALIANTEVRRAQSQGALEGYKETEKLGVEMFKIWLVADSPCAVCEPNGEQGAIPLDDEFDSGDDAPPAHPSCRCVLAPVVDPDAFEPEINPEEDMGYNAMAKYSDDEPRDERGRWTSGGEGEAASSFKDKWGIRISGERAGERSVSHQETVERIDEVDRVLTDLQQRYPALTKEKLSIAVAHIQVVDPGTLGYSAAADFSHELREIRLSATTDLSETEAYRPGKFTTASVGEFGDSSAAGAFRHELGHALEEQFVARGMTDRTFGDPKNSARLSVYATANAREYFAESFAAYTNPASPGKGVPTEMRKLFRSELKG